MDRDTYRYYNFELSYEINGSRHVKKLRIRANGKPEATRQAKEETKVGWFDNRKNIKLKYIKYEDDDGYGLG